MILRFGAFWSGAKDVCFDASPVSGKIRKKNAVFLFRKVVLKLGKTKNYKIILVRIEGGEPPHLAALVPKTSVSTNSTICAYEVSISLTIIECQSR